MSRRFQLQFFSCGENEKGGGGVCDKMIYAVNRDLITKKNVKNNEKKSTFLPPELNISFGIVDLDYSNDNCKKIEKEKLSVRIC